MTTDKYCSLKTELACPTTGSAYVYVVTNVIDGSKYIGKSVSPQKRWSDHKRAALKNSNALPHFYAALRLYGVETFEFVIDSAFKSEDEAFERERKLIAELTNITNIYNVSSGGRGGVTYSDSQRKSHSEIQRAWSNTDEARFKNSQAQLQSEVVKRKSEGMKRIWSGDEVYKASYMARVQSDENVQFHSERQKNAWKDPKRREKLLQGMHRPEIKAARKIRLSHEGNPRAKLTWELVEQIRTSFGNDNSMERLIEQFSNVSYGTLRRVVTNRAWVK